MRRLEHEVARDARERRLRHLDVGGTKPWLRAASAWCSMIAGAAAGASSAGKLIATPPADLAGFYRAFGFGRDKASHWQPDHLGPQGRSASGASARGARSDHADDEQRQVLRRLAAAMPVP